MSPSNGPEIPARRPKGAEGSMLARLQQLPRPAQIALAVAAFGVLYLFFGGRGEEITGQPSSTVTNTQAINTAASPTAVFTGIESDRPVLMQNWLEQNRRDMSTMKDQIESQFQARDQALTEALQQNAELQREMRQMMTDFTAEIQNMQNASQRDRETINQLAEEQRKMQLNAPVDGTSGESPVGRRQERINQTPLGSAGGMAVPGSQAFLSPLARAVNQPQGVVETAMGPVTQPPAPLPFMPPLGFVKATLLNGVDALVGGQPTPALVRLQGIYKTAMNSTVKLDGCYALVEFQGEISTERAVGKPARMTCVYPDSGTTTYSLSGYVVDAEDGIIGVPGVFYEGDASRIAAAMLADFAAGISEAVENNNNSFSLDQNGNAVRTVSGNDVRTEVAGGLGKATKSLRDYLMERVNRVLPFVRIDSTREIHMVLLSGVELRSEGSAWSLLFDAEAADRARVNSPVPETNNNPTQPVLPATAQGG